MALNGRRILRSVGFAPHLTQSFIEIQPGKSTSRVLRKWRQAANPWAGLASRATIGVASGQRHSAERPMLRPLVEKIWRRS